MQNIGRNSRFGPEAVAGFEHYRCGLRMGMRDETNPERSAEKVFQKWETFLHSEGLNRSGQGCQ
ncbi:hypothetical protein ACR79T_14105 [Sphingobacterium spiritivorum]|uniref:hypothetical protein n=1 Tax=Sphingobacterium spiritivorum TaxID=258 RepID=UPI003DA31FBE